MTAINTTSDTEAGDLSGLRAHLVSRLDRFRARVRTHLLLEGLAWLVGEVVVLSVIGFVLDRWLRLSVGVRWSLLAASIVFLIYELRRLITIPLQIKLSHIQLAALIDRAGRRGGTLAARMATVLDLPEQLKTTSPPSAAMVERAVREGDQHLRATQLEGFLNDDRHVTALGGIATLLVLATVIILLTPATSGLWFRRWFLGSKEPWPQDTHLRILGLVDGRLVVPKGEPFTLRVINGDHSLSPETAWIRYREGRAPRVNAAMNRFAPGDFRYDFPSIQEAASVELGGGDDEQGPFTIEAVDRPKLSEIELVSKHPTEANPAHHGFSGQETELAFLPKTQLELTFGSTVPVREAIIKSSSAIPSANQLRRIDDRHFALSWIHEAAVQLQIELVGEADLSSAPTPVTIGLKQDQPPRVSLTYSGVRQRVTPRAKIPLAIQARDDYGVARVDLDVKAELIDLSKATASTGPSTGPTTLPFIPVSASEIRSLYGPATKPAEQEISLQQTLEVSELKLTAGSLLSVSASAVDACFLGPQSSRSRIVTFRVVPPEELFKEILLRQQSERVKFRKQVEAAQKIAAALQTMPSVEAAATLAREHRLIQREVARTAAGLAESVTEMKLNALGGQEAWVLMDKNILGPLKTLHDDTMNRQREALDSLGGSNPTQLGEASQRQAQIVGKMQEILKQMSQWDSFVDVVNQLNEIIRLETRVKESAEQMKKKQTEGIFDP